MGYQLDLPSLSFNYSNDDSYVNVSGTSSSDNISNTGLNVSINAGAGNDTIKSDGTTFSTTTSVPETVTNYEPVYGYVTEPYIEYQTRYRKKSMYIPGYGTGGYTYYYDEPYSVVVTKYRSVYRQTGTRPVQSVVYNDVTTTETIKASYVTITGGTGDDLISLGSSTDHNLIQYSDGDGFDTVEGFGESDTLQIGNGKGVYSSQTSGSDIIVTVGDGEITIVGAANLGSDNVHIDGAKLLPVTNSTKSPMTVDSSVKNINASTNSKGTKITGNELANSIVGGSGKDYLVGAAGNDSIFGNEGNDKLFGGAGNDYLNGGAGHDSLNGGKGNDTINGGNDNDKIFGGAGKDSLNGGKGNDTLSGEDDDDILLGGAGKDSLNGGNGNDTLSGEDGDDILVGRDGKDSLNGGKGNDTINGGNDNDKIFGGAGKNSLNGGNGNDTLSGEDDDDILLGGAGKDCIIGGTGNDTLWGNDGADKFIYAAGDGKDVIFGFDDKDTLSLDGLDFTASCKSNAVTIKFDDGSITLKEFTATTFHIDKDTYKISGSKFVKQK